MGGDRLHLFQLLLALAALFAPAAAVAAIYQCEADGGIEFRDHPCGHERLNIKISPQLAAVEPRKSAKGEPAIVKKPLDKQEHARRLSELEDRFQKTLARTEPDPCEQARVNIKKFQEDLSWGCSGNMCRYFEKQLAWNQAQEKLHCRR